MSTTIQQNNTDLQSILDSVNALEPNSEGSVPDTCTVEIDNSGSLMSSISYIIVDATGQIITQTDTLNTTSITISNIVCGSVVYVNTGNYIGSLTNENNNTTLLFSTGDGHFAFIAPLNANATAKYTIYGGTPAPQ